MDYNPTDIRGQERAKADTEARRKQAADEEKADIKWLMKTRQGRRIVHGIIERSCLHQPFFNTNAMTMAFVGGRQVEGARLFTLVNELCPAHYLEMQKEANERNNPDDGS